MQVADAADSHSAERPSVITPVLRGDVLRRSERASTGGELGRAIVEALLAAHVDLNQVTLEDVKRLLVAATRAAKESNRSLGLK